MLFDPGTLLDLLAPVAMTSILDLLESEGPIPQAFPQNTSHWVLIASKSAQLKCHASTTKHEKPTQLSKFGPLQANMDAVQIIGQIYYRTSRDIEPGEELLLFYGMDYVEKNMPELLDPRTCAEKQSKGIALSFHEPFVQVTFGKNLTESFLDPGPDVDSSEGSSACTGFQQKRHAEKTKRGFQRTWGGDTIMPQSSDRRMSHTDTHTHTHTHTQTNKQINKALRKKNKIHTCLKPNVSCFL